MLVGEGSDEVFGGYDDMAHVLRSASAKWDRLLRLPRFVRAGLHGTSRLLGAPAGRTDCCGEPATGSGSTGGSTSSSGTTRSGAC